MNALMNSIFEELEKTQQDFWNVSRQTAVFLNMLIKISHSKNVLELGTSNGYSTMWLADALKQTSGHLTTIEFWDKRQILAIDNLTKCDLSDIVTFELGSACDIIPNLHQKFDFVFIDANKSEYIKYFNLIHPILSKKGIIAADNVLSHKEKVKDFVETISNHPEYQTDILDLPAGLLLSYKF